jgi:integrase
MGEGSIYQRKDGLWCAAVTIDRKQVVRYAKTRALAAQKLQELQAMAAGGLPEARKDITVEQLCQEYLEHKKPRWSPRSYGIAEGVIRLHLIPKLGAVKLAALDGRRVAVWLRGMGQTRTAQLARGHLSAACDLALRYDWMPRNPVKLTDAPKVVVAKPKDLGRDDIRAILSAAKTPPEKSPQVCKATDTDYYPVVAVLLGCGLRIGECLALRWEDWQEAGRTLSVCHTLTRSGKDGRHGAFELKPPKTIAGVRELVAPGFVAEALAGIQRRESAQGLIFCTASGGALDANNVRRGVMKLLKRSGIEGIGLHHLRHAHASLLLDDGVPLTIVASVLGHADASITARVYSHKLKGSHARVAQTMDELLGKDLS